MKGLVLTLALLANCSGVDDSIRGNLAAIPAEANGTVVRFEALIPGDWDRVYVFGPYTPEPVISKCIGTGASKRLTRGIKSSDSHNLLIFERRPQSFESVLIPRNNGDFTRESIGRWYDRSSANFVMTEDSNGWRRLNRAEEASGTC